MRVSVIIAVYNAEDFVATAIASALSQPETCEVVIVEDGSPDNALQICQDMAARDTRIKIFRHLNGINRGAGASFNLGIQMASEPFVAILGADDQYVENAFAHAKHVFASYPDADGAHAHIGVRYYDEEYKKLHLKRIPREISGMVGEIPPENLLCSLLHGGKGHFSLDSLVVRRQILTEEYLFDESLRLGQDTDFIYRLSSAFRLYGPKETTIVALRGVHAGNRVFDFKGAAHYRKTLLRKCMDHDFYGCRNKEAVVRIIHRYLRGGFISRIPLLPHQIKRHIAILLFLWTHPRVYRLVRKCR